MIIALGFIVCLHRSASTLASIGAVDHEDNKQRITSQELLFI